MMKRFLVSVVCFFLIGQSYGQDSIVVLKKHFIGLGAGTSTGLGMSYRYKPSKWAIQGNFFPFYKVKKDVNELYNNEYKNTTTFLSLGLSFYRYIKFDKNIDVFGYLGNHLLVYQEKTTNYFNGQAYVEDNLNNRQYTVGVGLGFDFKLGERIVWSLSGGYGAYLKLYQKITTLQLTGETGLYYRF